MLIGAVHEGAGMVKYGYLLPTRGCVIGSSDPETLSAKTQADILGLAERAEQTGFDSVWIGDSVLARPRLEPLSTLASVASVTDSVMLGTAVYLPLLRHPVNIAHQAATVDQISGARLLLGVGAGSANPEIIREHENVGRSFDHRGDRLNEALKIMTELWEGESVDFAGEYYQVEDASIGFQPVSRPRIYVPTGSYDSSQGFPNTIAERITSVGGGCLPNVIDPDRYEDSITEITRLLESAGRDPTRFDNGLYLDVVVDDDEEAALEQAREFYSAYYSDRADYTREEIRQRGAFGSLGHVKEVLRSYESVGAETIVLRFVTRKQRANFTELAPFLNNSA